MNIFQIEGLTKVYGPREVLRVDNLEVKGGEILGIMGPSGSGKSTLLRLLNFLEPPTEGTIHFLGKAIQGNGGPPLDLQRKITMVFQRPLLLSGTEREPPVAVRHQIRSALEQRPTLPAPPNGGSPPRGRPFPSPCAISAHRPRSLARSRSGGGAFGRPW